MELVEDSIDAGIVEVFSLHQGPSADLREKSTCFVQGLKP